MKKGVELDDVSYIDFLGFEDDKFSYYKRLGVIMKPDPWDLEEIFNWPYGKVKEMQMMFTTDVNFQDIPQILSFAFSHKQADKVIQRSPEQFAKMKWHQVFRYWNHVMSENRAIIEREKLLEFEPDADQVAAGIENLAKFGAMATIDTLAGGNVLMWDEIETKPYHLIFAKLYLETEKAKYLEALREIKIRKSQQKR